MGLRCYFTALQNPRIVKSRFYLLLIFSALLLMPVFGSAAFAQETTVEEETKPKKEKKKKEKKAEEEAPAATAEEEAAGLGWRKKKKLAKKLQKQGSYYNAAEYYKQALAKKPNKTKIAWELAELNFMLRDYVSAEKYYDKVKESGKKKKKFNTVDFQLGQSQKMQGKYQEAMESFNNFNSAKLKKDQEGMKGWARMERAGCVLGMELDTVKARYDVKNAGEGVNGPFTEFSPYPKSSNTLYYSALTSNEVVDLEKAKDQQRFSRIYSSTRIGGSWNPGNPLSGDINKQEAHIGNPSLSPDGKRMYYTVCEETETLGMICQIYESKEEGGSWSKGEALPKPVNVEGASSTHPHLAFNADGVETLYFSSNRTGGEGGMDIYYAERAEDGSYGRVYNMGRRINSDRDDITPYYDSQHNYLYFSSNGQVNIGGHDIYRVAYDKASGWSEPEHMGLPLNSSVDDMYYRELRPGKDGFLVSNREGGQSLKSPTCCDDIWEFKFTDYQLAVTGRLYVEVNGERSPAEEGFVSLFKSPKDSFVATYEIEGEEDMFFFNLGKASSYSLVSSKEGFTDVSLDITTLGIEESDTLVVDLVLKKAGPPKFPFKIPMEIGIVYFEFDVGNLRADAPQTLDSVVYYMETYKNLILEVGGHTDSKGSDAYNLRLSQERAESVKNYLVSRDIPEWRLVAKGYGETRHIAPNTNPDGTDNPEGRQLNRRVEFIIIKELTPEEMKELEESSGGK